MKILTLNLKEVAAEVGGVDAQFIDEVEGVCECGTYITQVMDECPSCHVAIAWKYSDVWDWMYREWIHPMARYLFSKSNTHKFRTGAEYHRFKHAVFRMSENDVQDTIDRCAKSASGRELVRYALNALDAKCNKLEEPQVVIDDRGVRSLD